MNVPEHTQIAVSVIIPTYTSERCVDEVSLIGEFKKIFLRDLQREPGYEIDRQLLQKIVSRVSWVNTDEHSKKINAVCIW